MNMLDEIPEQEKDHFDQYFEEVIIPLTEEENRLKDKYKGHFWATLWILLFINCANTLIVLYGALQNGHRVSFEQILLIYAISMFIVYIPIKKYKKLSHKNLFGEFLKFYKNFTYSDKKIYTPALDTDIVPQAPYYLLANTCTTDTDSVKTTIKDIQIGNKSDFKIPSDYGVYICLEFEKSQNIEVVMTDKSGIFGASKHPYLQRFKRDSIPASKYFDIFTDNEENAKNLLGVAFFESTLDLKEVFAAKKMQLKIKGNKIEIFFEKTSLYFETISFFGQKTDKNKFLHLHKQFEQLTIYANTMQALMEY